MSNYDQTVAAIWLRFGCDVVKKALRVQRLCGAVTQKNSKKHSMIQTQPYAAIKRSHAQFIKL